MRNLEAPPLPPIAHRASGGVRSGISHSNGTEFRKSGRIEYATSTCKSTFNDYPQDRCPRWDRRTGRTSDTRPGAILGALSSAQSCNACGVISIDIVNKIYNPRANRGAQKIQPTATRRRVDARKLQARAVAACHAMPREPTRLHPARVVRARTHPLTPCAF